MTDCRVRAGNPEVADPLDLLEPPGTMARRARRAELLPWRAESRGTSDQGRPDRPDLQGPRGGMVRMALMAEMGFKARRESQESTGDKVILEPMEREELLDHKDSKDPKETKATWGLKAKMDRQEFRVVMEVMENQVKMAILVIPALRASLVSPGHRAPLVRRECPGNRDTAPGRAEAAMATATATESSAGLRDHLDRLALWE